MDAAAPKLRKFAQRLLSIETAGAEGPAAFRVCEQLRRALTKFAGRDGFHALLARALVLAQGEVRWLKAVRVKPDGTLEGLSEAEAKLSNDEVARGETIFVAHLIGLLATFIGEALALQLVREAWPGETFSD